MKDNICIRPVQNSDFGRWLPLWEGYNAFYKRSVPAEVTKGTWDRFLEFKEPMHALIAEKDGELLGFVHFLFHRNTAMLNDICYLQDLFTVESARGQGVGRALIQAVYERAKQEGATRVYWLTHESNTVAKILYEKVADYSGFVVFRKQIT